MHLCPHLKELYTSDCGITSDDLIWLLDIRLTQFKSSSPSLCSKLEDWDLDSNQIGERDVSALMDHLPSLFPRLRHGINYQYNNLVSSEVKKRLEEKLRERTEVSYSVTYYCSIIC